MQATIQKATSRGQITLPAAWRRQFNTNSYILETTDTFLKIKPVDIDELVREELVIFDADRDHEGKGIKAKNLIKIIDSIDG
ncbi:MAG: hypothetical protein AAB525_03850 [Patescibacteria group bacterium]